MSKKSQKRICYLCRFTKKRNCPPLEACPINPPTFHKFPSKGPVLSAWIRICGLDENVDNTKQVTICSNHFTVNDYIDVNARSFGGQIRLKSTAVPNIAVPVAKMSRITENSVCRSNSKKICLEISSKISIPAASSIQIQPTENTEAIEENIQPPAATQFVDEMEINSNVTELMTSDPLEITQQSKSKNRNFISNIDGKFSEEANSTSQQFINQGPEHNLIPQQRKPTLTTNEPQEIILVISKVSNDQALKKTCDRISREKEMLMKDLIPQITKVIDNITCMEQVDVLRRLIAPIAPTLEAIQKCKNQNSIQSR